MLIRLVSAVSVGAFFAAPGLGQSIPPPPPAILEFFIPTPRDHSVSAACPGGNTAALAWTFDGQDATLRSFTFAGSPLDPPQLAQMQAWMSEIGGDILIDLECGGNAASMRIMNAQFAGSAGGSPMIRVHLIDGKLSEFGRYNFDRRLRSQSQRRSDAQ